LSQDRIDLLAGGYAGGWCCCDFPYIFRKKELSASKMTASRLVSRWMLCCLRMTWQIPVI
jgi:hypothetical protein